MAMLQQPNNRNKRYLKGQLTLFYKMLSFKYPQVKICYE